jgi:hypothetical protein
MAACDEPTASGVPPLAGVAPPVGVPLPAVSAESKLVHVSTVPANLLGLLRGI